MDELFKMLKLKTAIYIPVKDKNGLSKDKALKVVIGSDLHKKLLNDLNINELPKDLHIIED